MGDYTTNNYFYKPSIGASGATEKGKYDDALDITDGQIEANKDNIAMGYLPMLTTDQIKVLANSSNVLQVFNTDMNQVELWVRGARKPGR